MNVNEAGILSSDPGLRPLELAYVDSGQLATLLHDGRRSLLGEIHFGPPLRALDRVPHPHAVVGMPQLGVSRLAEVWTSDLPVTYHRDGNLAIAHNREVLFGSITCAADGTDPFEWFIRDSYLQVLSVLRTEGYPYPLRMWNYFPGIAHMIDGLDRYQVFCRGRFQALETHYGQFEGRLPSASAVGSIDGGLAIYFIAAREPGRNRENPRQMSAYHYPTKYGPRSPSFARATFKRWGAAKGCLYISGTASIVGHESVHPDDPAAQIDETLRNLGVLIDGAQREEGANFHGFDSISHLKIYIRDRAHFELISNRLARELSPQIPQLYLAAEICRRDLLLEIEAVVQERS
ncbi:MAG: chorismate transformation enzyme, FkbO/Hyg5 family [Acidiferrobacterales bacterium]